MKYVKHIGLICMLVIFLMTISAISAEENQTVFDGNFSDLQAKIDQTEENGILELDKNYSVQGELYKDNNLKINKNIIIEGNNKTIKLTQSMINISKSNVVFKDMTMDDVSIFAVDSTISLINCNFINSHDSTYFVNGKSLYLYGLDLKNSNLNVVNSNFIDFEGNLAQSGVKNALRGLRDEARNMRILGNY